MSDPADLGGASTESVEASPEKPSLRCDGCGQTFAEGAALQACSACVSVYYCSQKCQRVGWKAGHKVACKDLAARRAAAPSPCAGGGPAHAAEACDGGALPAQPGRLTEPAFLSHVQALLSSNAQASQAAAVALAASAQLRKSIPVNSLASGDFSKAQGALYHLSNHKDRALAMLSAPGLPAPLRALAAYSLQPTVELASRLCALSRGPMYPYLVDAAEQAAELVGADAAWAAPSLGPIAAALAAASKEPPGRAPAVLALLHAHTLSIVGGLLFAVSVDALKRKDDAGIARMARALKPFLLGVAAAVAASTHAAPLVPGPAVALLCLHFGGILRSGHAGTVGAAMAAYLRLLALAEKLPAGGNPERELQELLKQVAGCIRQGNPLVMQGLRSAGGAAALAAATAALPLHLATALEGVKI